jgi:hypothetical protein
MYLFTHLENLNHIRHLRSYKVKVSDLYASYMTYMVQNKTDLNN